MSDGIINVLKPPGMTSHDVVSFIRRIYGIKRVGHAGTLDPAAAGVLPVFLGTATRIIEYTTEADKAYRAELTLGFATDSGDDTGREIARVAEFTFPAEEKIQSVMQSFVGLISQTPPMHSAIKIDGKRLYELARQGLEVTRKSREVLIDSINLLRIEAPVILFDVTCSKGTYIRSLCADISEKLGCPGVMSFLVRTRVGIFHLSGALTLEEIAQQKLDAILPADHAISDMPKIVLTDEKAKAFGHGQIIGLAEEQSHFRFRVYNDQDDFIGIGEKRLDNNCLTPVKVFRI